MIQQINDWGKNIQRAIVVGAYDAEEWDNPDWVYIEPLKGKYEELKQRFPKVLNYAILDRNGEIEFNITNNLMSSSVLPLKVHKEHYPGIVYTEKTIVKCRTLDDLIDSGEIRGEYDGLIMDVQGAEHLVLKGFEKHLGMIKHIIAEVNYQEMYEGCMLEVDFTKWLQDLGFTKVDELKQGEGFGDAFYQRK